MYNYLATAKEYHQVFINSSESLKELEAKAENFLNSAVRPGRPAFVTVIGRVRANITLTPEQQKELEDYKAKYNQYKELKNKLLYSKEYADMIQDIERMRKFVQFNKLCRDIALRLYSQKTYLDLCVYAKKHPEEFRGLKGYFKKTAAKVESLCPGWSYHCSKVDYNNPEISFTFQGIKLVNIVWFFDWHDEKLFREEELRDEKQFAVVSDVNVEDMARAYIDTQEKAEAIIAEAKSKLHELSSNFPYYPQDCVYQEKAQNWKYELELFKYGSYEDRSKEKYKSIGEIVASK